MRYFAPLSLAAVAAVTLAACSPGGAKGIATVRETDFFIMGKADAPVTVTEYASMSCPHCARFNEEVMPQIKTKYIETGQVKWIMREFLTPPQEVAAAGFLTARCAGKDKAYLVLDAVFRGIAHDAQAFFNGPRNNLLTIAQSAGMTQKQFDDCVGDEKALEELKKRVQRNAKDGIEGTPTFFVNGVRMGEKEGGEQTLAQFDAAIAAAKAGKDPNAAAKAAAPKAAE
jgi:protein-disulfide isomerase